MIWILLCHCDMLQVMIDELRGRVPPKLFLSRAREFLKFVTRACPLWAREKWLVGEGKYLWQELLHPPDSSPIAHVRDAG